MIIYARELRPGDMLLVQRHPSDGGMKVDLYFIIDVKRVALLSCGCDTRSRQLPQ